MAYRCRLRGLVLGEALSPGFEVNDLGYLPATDRLLAASSISYTRGEPQGPFLDWWLGASAWNGFNFGGERTLVGGNVNAGVQFRDRSSLTAFMGMDGRSLDTTALRGGPAVLSPLGWTLNARYESDPRHRFSTVINAMHSLSEDHLRRYTSLQSIRSTNP